MASLLNCRPYSEAVRRPANESSD